MEFISLYYETLSNCQSILAFVNEYIFEKNIPTWQNLKLLSFINKEY